MVKSMSAARQQLLTLLARQSFRLGQFTLSSGGTSDYYVDCRTTTLHAEGARLTARVFLDEIQRRKWRPQAIGGLTMGADPIVVAVAMLSAQEVQARAGEFSDREGAPEAASTSSASGSVPTGAPLPAAHELIHGLLVRKSEKSHGTGQRIEGFREKGAPVVIVDDVCTTGASTVQAIEAAREFGFEVVGVMCLVERLEGGAPGESSPGRQAIERAASGVPFISIFTSSEVRQEHLAQLDRLRAELEG
jgi:orotate phosphoribosyltransferase